MRKLVIFAIMAVIFVSIVWGAVTAPTSVVASLPTPTKFTVTYSGQSELDSLIVIHFSGSDSLVLAVADTSETTVRVTSLTPNTEYIIGMYAIDSGSKKAVSGKDTMNTKVEYKYRVSTSTREGSAYIPRNTADPSDGVWDIIHTFNAASDVQTSCYFKPQAYTVIAPILLNSVADSTKLTGIIYGGWDDSTTTAVGGAIQGIDVIGDAPADTISVTSHLQASNPATKVSILPYDWAYIVWTADTACGNAIRILTKFGYSKE